MAPDKVLVALDESPKSNRALRFALRRAALAHDEVWALSVLDTRRVMLATRPSAHGSPEMASLAENLAHVLDEARQAARGVGVDLKTDMRPSADPAAAIVHFAREGGFGQIVLGHREKRGVERVVLGSTAIRVLELSELPVTIVR